MFCRGAVPLLAVLSLAEVFTGCARRVARPDALATAPPAPDRGTYIDLQPGWRLSVITPLLKSSSYRLERQADKAEATETTGRTSTLTVSAGPDFLGYERSYYTVEARRGGGVQLRFSSAETVQEDKTSPQTQPKLRLFRLPRQMRHVRLVYLVRGSQADHNMAVVAAARPDDLAALTHQVQMDPTNGCAARSGAVCEWIPAGIAVRPELRRPGSSGDWTPAR